MKQSETRTKSALRENVEAILIAVCLALLIRTFVVQAFKIPSGSMLQTLQIGDHILVSKFLYGVKLPFVDKIVIPVTDPKRGDIIVFKYPLDPSMDYIKRVVGVPGDVIEVVDKQLYRNGKAVTMEPYVQFVDPRIFWGAESPRDNMGPVTVPEDSYFVMGDNRDNSQDSRFWGFVPRRAIKGKAFVIYWSWDSKAFGVRWNRLGDWLH